MESATSRTVAADSGATSSSTAAGTTANKCLLVLRGADLVGATVSPRLVEALREALPYVRTY